MSDGPKVGEVIEIEGRPHFLAWTYHDPEVLLAPTPQLVMAVIAEYMQEGESIVFFGDETQIEFDPDFDLDEEEEE